MAVEPPGAYINVRLFGELARYAGDRGYEFTWPLATGRTIAEILEEIGIPSIEVWMVALGGNRVDLDTVPVAGDELMVFSPVGGG